MKEVNEFIQNTMKREGGYVNHPHDKGGETNFGITKQVARDWGYHGPMKNLTKEIAHSIYFYSYWVKPQFHTLAEISAPIAGECFDTGVLCGSGTGIRFLQRALTAFNLSGALYSDLEQDGLLGDKTFSALRAYLEHRGKQGVTVLLKALNCLQGTYFITLAELREQNESFVYGWINHRIELLGNDDD